MISKHRMAVNPTKPTSPTILTQLTKLVAAAIAVTVALTCVSSVSATSYDNITQNITVPEGWRRIVENSQFQLGAGTTDDRVGIISYGTYPSIDGSTVAVPMAMEFARQHLGMTNEDDLYSFVFFSTTHNAYENLILGKANQAAQMPTRQAIMEQSQRINLFIGTEPSDEELKLAADNGVDLVQTPVCLDAFVFIVNADNPIDNLSIDQIKQIYTGRVRTWSAFGGSHTSIDAYQRAKNSGSQTAMENLVMQGEQIEGVNYNYITSGMEGLVAAVGEYKNGIGAIGYTYLYYLNELVDSQNVKVIAVNGIAPTEQNIRSGEYPFSTKYYAVTRGDAPDDTGVLFAQWMASDEGQAVIKQAGYIPVADTEGVQ